MSEFYSKELENKERLKDLEDDMNDAYKSWQEAEQEIKDALAWRDKQALYYAENTVKFYNFKKEIN